MSHRKTISRRGLLAAGAAAPLTAATAFAQATESRPKPAAVRKRVLRLAHLTDVHVYGERSAGEGFAACLQHVQSRGDAPELIVFGGDNLMNVDGDGRDTAKEQLAIWNRTVADHCSLPHRIAIGNHDVLAMDPVDGKKWAADAFGLSNRYYDFDSAGWKFIVLDSTYPVEGGYKGRLDGEQMEWLAETLGKTDAETPVCVVSHIPIIAPCSFFDGENEKTGDWVVPGAWMHIDARALKDRFFQHPNVRLCLSGHMHLVDTAGYLGVNYACNGAVSGAWWKGRNYEFDAGYALVDLYDDGTSEVEYVTYGWTAKP